MKTRRYLLACILGVALLSLEGAAQQSGRQFRRSAVMNGNQVRSVFGNWGVIGQPVDTRPRGAWKDDNNGYLGDVSPFVGAEVQWLDTNFHSVVTCPVARPTQAPDQSPSGKAWTFEPVDGYFGAPPNESIALSNNTATWPEHWPDKMNDPVDPGWRKSWNGYFGKRISADLESYYVMDDNNDERFNAANNNARQIAFVPDSLHPNRKGLGLVMNVRAMQWAQFLAQDNIFWLYEITNTSTTTYNRAVFGMLVGTYVGVTGSDGSPQEYDDDWSFYDPKQNITYTGDYDRNTLRNPRWNQKFPVGMVGYAFLETPGNPFDGIDNDGDADSSAVGRLAPVFTSTSFDSTVIRANTDIVLINPDFSRRLFRIANRPVKVITRGMRDSVLITPGVTKLAEGNLLRDSRGNLSVNPNVYDGVDNDFDGLIDENIYLHFRQFKPNPDPQKPPLFDIPRAVRYVNSLIVNPNSMIDERRNDLIDNDGDWIDPDDDVGRDGIGPKSLAWTAADVGEGDHLPTSGYDNFFLDTGLPGEPNIDKTDVKESDQIGLSSFFYFAPAPQVNLADDEELWKDLAPGFFDVPRSIEDGRPLSGEDGDFIYGSGYFPLVAGTTERFSLALVYGGGKGGSLENDILDLLKNKKTVQKIYDANYLFPTPPDPPTLTAVPGDHKVTLYWDRAAEESIDPVLKVKDFEGYKIYKSTDPDFSDIYTVTDANGTPRAYRPLAQFDLLDGVQGYFRASGDLYEAAGGLSFNLGSNTGLQHTYVDVDVDNGRRYFYAVVAYDKGDEIAGIFPGENTKAIRFASTGEISNKDINVAVVTPNAKAAGYVRPNDGVLIPQTRGSGSGSGTITYSVVDETKLTGNRYRVEFLDTETDTIDNNFNGRKDASDSTEWDRKTSFFSVRYLEDVTEEFGAQDTVQVSLQRKHLVPLTVSVRDNQGLLVPSANYVLDLQRGSIRGASPGTLPQGRYFVTYQYYPVFHSANIQGSPFITENTESDIYDGVQLNFKNVWNVTLDDKASGWVGPNAYLFQFTPVDLPLIDPPIFGYRKPVDYEIQFSNTIVDTSSLWPPQSPNFPFDTPIPVYFRIFNVTDSVFVKFLFYDASGPGQNTISSLDQLVFLDENPRGTATPSWSAFFSKRAGNDTVYQFTSGDKLRLHTTKPFQSTDAFEFATVKPKIDAPAASQAMANIRVVPNPYVTASAFEPPLPSGITSGRGERKIDFIHLPAQSKVHIFTSRGDRIATLLHDGNIEDGSVSWNLKTEENLDVAFGVYFYVVESPVGTKTGKIAIIK